MGVIKLYEDVEDEVTATAERQMEVLIENSYSYEDLEEKLKPYLNDIDQEISEVINRSSIKHYVDEKKAYELANKHLMDYTKNDRVAKINRMIKDKLLDNNKMITNSMGVAYNGKGYSLQEFYTKEINKHVLMVSSGAFDRKTAIRKLINSLGDSGIKSINNDKSGRNYL